MTTRNGKIARLPKRIRDDLNDRLEDGAPGKQLVEWLNGLPEVQEVLQLRFGGRSISEQNLSEWKQGGYQEWLKLQESRYLVQHLLGSLTRGVAGPNPRSGRAKSPARVDATPILRSRPTESN